MRDVFMVVKDGSRFLETSESICSNEQGYNIPTVLMSLKKILLHLYLTHFFGVETLKNTVVEISRLLLFKPMRSSNHSQGLLEQMEGFLKILLEVLSLQLKMFLGLVRRTCGIKPLMAAIGSCCLVGVIWRGMLYVANLGDSRAVIGCLSRSNKIVAEQLTSDHNASKEEVRQELRSLHPDDSHIVVMKHGVWRIKGIIQVSRSIGDAYLKRPEFSLDPSFPWFHLSEPIRRPVLTAEPSLCTRVLQPSDKFLIFASDGLWEHLTNQQAVEIVSSSPRAEIAKRLIRTALNEVARKREMRYDYLKKVDKGIRRFFHDDITVVVIFRPRIGWYKDVPEQSVKGFADSSGPSNFNIDVNQEMNGSII
ncbi:putative protein phosphatase 2C 43 [Hibiscus syriacus]|uniref:PPM-type phosphatase domain-containing protein n=1 Tax=Hibiscus syriacus TaxID=106335 RepID=A0A6A2XLS6_HIBSY|nr:putative protein phosphatase 2C 43 [Hibiscus syriacus]